jgi:hypothetical protein
VLTKLGVHSRLQAAALVSREGLLDQLRSGAAAPCGQAPGA